MIEVPSENKKAAKERNRNKHAKILIVDDDAGIRETLNDIFTQSGYKTKTAQTGREAITAVQRESFDVALIDIKLPDMVGINLLDIMKKMDPTLIKIIITGYPSLENAVQSLNSGADGFVVKPFKPIRLLEQIKEQLQGRQKAKLERMTIHGIGLSCITGAVFLQLLIFMEIFTHGSFTGIETNIVILTLEMAITVYCIVYLLYLVFLRINLFLK